MASYTNDLQPDETVTGGRPAPLVDLGTLLIRGTGAGFEPLAGVGAPLRISNAIVAG